MQGVYIGTFFEVSKQTSNVVYFDPSDEHFEIYPVHFEVRNINRLLDTEIYRAINTNIRDHIRPFESDDVMFPIQLDECVRTMSKRCAQERFIKFALQKQRTFILLSEEFDVPAVRLDVNCGAYTPAVLDSLKKHVCDYVDAIYGETFEYTHFSFADVVKAKCVPSFMTNEIVVCVDMEM